ncbi:MAG: hypothetical protein KAR39_10905 [Thermoplasmata archaeon]|nr:hypothetical protein [Thermoplasmata archaeon]
MRSQYALELIATLWYCLMGFAHMENTVIMDRLALAAGIIGSLYMTRAFLKWIIDHELKGQTNAKKNIDITVNVDSDGLVSHGMREYSGPSKNRSNHIG